MPVFDFSNTPDANKDPVCTYTTFRSNESVPSGSASAILRSALRRKNTYSSAKNRCPRIRRELS